MGVWTYDSIGIEIDSYEFKVLIPNISIYGVRTLHLFLKFYMHNSSKQIFLVWYILIFLCDYIKFENKNYATHESILKYFGMAYQVYFFFLKVISYFKD